MKKAGDKIMLIAGGTGGHVYPALALAHELIQHGTPVSFLTDRRGIRYLEDLAPSVALRIMPLGSKPSSIWRHLFFFWQLAASFFTSLSFIIRQNPKKIIGYGGYPTFPGLVAGLLLGKKLYASEQDAVLGSMNRRFARFYQKIFLATPLLKPLEPELAHKCALIGMPVRSQIAALNNHLYQPPSEKGEIYFTVIGGSQGAAILSEVVPQALQQLPASVKERLRVTQQCRGVDVDPVKQSYHQFGIQATVHPFFDQMNEILARTHLIICRSGASTVAEVIAAALPAIFVPYPHAAHDHQTVNASLLGAQGAGWLISQSNFTPEHCSAYMRKLLMHPRLLLFASERLKLFSQKNVTQTLASQILSV